MHHFIGNKFFLPRNQILPFNPHNSGMRRENMISELRQKRDIDNFVFTRQFCITAKAKRKSYIFRMIRFDSFHQSGGFCRITRISFPMHNRERPGIRAMRRINRNTNGIQTRNTGKARDTHNRSQTPHPRYRILRRTYTPFLFKN